MPGQTGSEVRVRTIVLPTRWSPEELARLTAIAEFTGCTRAEILRRLVHNSSRQILATRELTRQLAAIGNNLNQIARRQNAGASVPGGELLAVYRALLAALTDLKS